MPGGPIVAELERKKWRGDGHTLGKEPWGATAKGSFNPVKTPVEPGPPGDAHEILCANCDGRIADYTKCTVCPFCEQTNFLGVDP